MIYDLIRAVKMYVMLLLPHISIKNRNVLYVDKWKPDQKTKQSDVVIKVHHFSKICQRSAQLIDRDTLCE